MSPVDARYELSRLLELLALVGPLLRAEGVHGPETEALEAEARDMAARLRGLRAEHAARLAECVR